MSKTFLELLASKKQTTTVNHDKIENINHAETVANNLPFIKHTNGETAVSPIGIIVERVLDRNRLDLHFQSIPSEETRQKLKDQGFRFNPDSKCWYHQDSLVNRLFCADTFGLSDLLQDPYNDDKKTDQTVPSFETYKDQVNALIQELNLDASDLMLVAVNCLYSKTFKDIN